MFSAEEGQKTSGSYKYKIRRPAKSLRIGSFLLFMLFLFKYAWVLRGQRQVSSIQAATSASLGMRHLPRSGWSVGRAGLGVETTYPAKSAQRENNAVGIGLFTFISSIV